MNNMSNKIYSVYDSKAEAYLPPFTCPTRAVAQRMVAQATMDINHDFSRFGGDYTLFELAEWDLQTGNINVFDVHFNCGTALELGNLGADQ